MAGGEQRGGMRGLKKRVLPRLIVSALALARWVLAPGLVEGKASVPAPSSHELMASTDSISPSWPQTTAIQVPMSIPPSPQRVIDVTFWSVSLQRYMPLLIYLPPGYNSASGLPVLYMLHGL